MLTRVQKWGNSQGLRVSKDMLADAGIKVGDAVDVSVADGTIVVVPARRVRGALDLRELLEGIPQGHRAEELDWGPAVGGEVW
jgi:antitoxin MazE